MGKRGAPRVKVEPTAKQAKPKRAPSSRASDTAAWDEAVASLQPNVERLRTWLHLDRNITLM